MCGITGFIDFTNQSTRQTASKMADTMAHRGPDGQQEFFEQANDFQIGLGHRRLSVIDLSQEAAQPMFYDKWVIVYNGEIYNFREIKGELISLGHVFTTHSDTEVILHSWQEWGKSAIKKWHGMFAIALYNKHTNELTIIRDRAGVKPLYYYYDDGLFLFGSELKTLMGHPGFKKAINPDAIASFLQYGYVPGPYAIFNHTHKLQPGYLLQFDLASQTIITEQYWNVYDYYNKPKLKISLPDAISETERILERAFRYRMVSDVPVGVFLSGGYDSTCVTALLQKNSTEKLKTFTIGMTDGKLNEAPFAKEIANKLGTNHTEQYCTIDEALEILPTLPDYYDEPFADTSALPSYYLSKIARQKVTVALSGDGGDENFAGYRRYIFDVFENKIRNIVPSWLRTPLFGMLGSLYPKADWLPQVFRAKTLFQNLAKEPFDAYFNTVSVYNETLLNTLLTDSFKQKLDGYSSRSVMKKYYDRADGCHYLDKVLYTEIKTFLPDDYLVKVDRASMANALEVRVPLLDHKFMEFTAKIPASMKLKGKEGKYIFKKALEPLLSHNTLYRKKRGFELPIDNWLRGELKERIEVSILAEDSFIQSIIKREYIEKIWNQHQAGVRNYGNNLWLIFFLESWHKKYICS